MAFAAAFESLPELMTGITNGSQLLSSMIQAETQQTIASNGMNMSMAQQSSNQNFQTQLQAGNFQQQQILQNNNQQMLQNMQERNLDQNLTLQQNSFGQQNTYQQNAFQQQNQLQQNSFNQQNSMLSSTFANNMKAVGVTAGANLGSNLLSTGINYLASSALMNQQASLQRENFSYMTGQASAALTANGMPSWMAYTGMNAQSALPRTSQVINGSNTFNSQLPGNVVNIPWQNTPSQITFGVGDVPTAQ